MEETQNYCPNCHGYYLQNQVTSEIFRLGCNRYDCEHCGKIKIWKFKKALYKYFKNFHTIKFWTFNVRTTKQHNNKHFNKLSNEVWRRFCIMLRRDPHLTAYQSKFQYVKVTEFTKEGFVHFHVVINVFMPFDIVYHYWNKAIASTFKMDYDFLIGDKPGNESLGGVNVQSIPNAKKVTNYVTKYLLKACQDLTQKSGQLLGISRKRIRIYTKSNSIVLFPKKHSCNSWLFINAGGNSEREAIYLYLLAVTSQEIVAKWTQDNPFLAET